MTTASTKRSTSCSSRVKAPPVLNHQPAIITEDQDRIQDAIWSGQSPNLHERESRQYSIVFACALIALTLCFTTESMAESYMNSVGMKLVRIEPGTYSMGSTVHWDEQPVHQVTISKPFSMATTEVTNSQFEQFAPDHHKLRGKLGFSTEDDEAVVFVSWHDAMAYCNWLGEKEGKNYRLPSEAEWEFACRAGTTTDYHTGDELPEVFQKNAKVSWYPGRKSAGDIVPLHVGRTPPNAFGLHDMHGNVEEWCLDWYGPYAANAQTDPIGRVDGDFRVTRGGSHSTTLQFLRSANRSGTLPADSSWLIGFRIVAAEMPSSEPLPAVHSPLNARDVTQKIPANLTAGPDPNTPFFEGPRPYVIAPKDQSCPVFNRHNHCPALVNCANGDLLAIWYTCRDEPGRELGIVASRLPYGNTEWQPASSFWDAPDRNDHASALWVDERGTLYHFNGLGAAATWGSLATILRTSTDNGATWSKARLIMPEHGLRHMPIESVMRAQDGAILVPCDAVTGGHGGSAVLVGSDDAKTWVDPGEGRPAPTFESGRTGAWIAGIHAGFTQLKDGRLLAFGRGNNIDGRMPMSISKDMGSSWTYSPSPFPAIGGGQRLVVLRLKEGPILFCSFARELKFQDAARTERTGSGLFAALSSDEGESWQIKRLITDDGAKRPIEGGGNTGRFIMSRDSAEPRGYLSICQAANGVIHLIASKQHYSFNLAWLNTPPPAKPDTHKVPGVVIDHSPASSGIYLGSPGIAKLDDNTYLAKCDEFGPASKEHRSAITRVFRSRDKGVTWKQTARVEGLFWASIFMHQNHPFLLGMNKHHGAIVVMRSDDEGESWTSPTDKEHGLLTNEGQFHTAPVPLIQHDGRLWRAVEDAMGGTRWGKRYRARMLSIPINADPMLKDNWVLSEPLASNTQWLDGEFGGWLEGNAVRTPADHVVNILRVECPEGGKAAVVRVTDDGKELRFDPAQDMIDFPGGAKKFTIRFDPVSQAYWTLSNPIMPRHLGETNAGSIRNTLALMRSKDLRNWEIRCILIYHPDVNKHGFQYPDWLFDGDDLIGAIRTGYDDGVGGAHNAHDANFLTFHRFTNFRSLKMEDSRVDLEKLKALPDDALELDGLSMRSRFVSMKPFGNGKQAFSNRTYVWQDVPSRYDGWSFSQIGGGQKPLIEITAQRDITLHVATSVAWAENHMPGWEPTNDTFCYTDGGRTRMCVLKRNIDAGRKIRLLQGGWAGTLLLIPPK